MKAQHCILQIIDQYALAYHGTDTEFYVCRMTTGKTKEFNDSDHELEIDEFFDDEDAYWKKRGWHIIMKDNQRTLTPIA